MRRLDVTRRRVRHAGGDELPGAAASMRIGGRRSPPPDTVARSRIPVSRAGSAAALAWGLERWCLAGIALRAEGRCASREHERAGRRAGAHDAGCLTLGIPFVEIGRELRRRDRVSAAGLLLEAVAEAVEEIAGYGDAWTAAAAAESLAYALRRRIGPVAPRSETR